VLLDLSCCHEATRHAALPLPSSGHDRAWLGADCGTVLGGVDFGHGQLVSSLQLLDAVLSYAWRGAYFACCFGGITFCNGQEVSCPLLNAVFRYVFGADCVFVLVSCIAGDLRQLVSPLIPLCTVLRHAGSETDCVRGFGRK
jgi:hypothetical protein